MIERAYGTSADFDPAVFTYDSTTGQLTYADYVEGTEVDTASFEYDGAGRVTRIRDWIDDVDGLQYGYDELGRLTSVTDYDGSALSYVYDAVGRVTSMTDYHSNVTSYSYTNLNQLDTITAPGNRVWDFDYNANGFPVAYTHPNGMLTEYEYDDQNRLTDIRHKDGMTIEQRFDYTFDDNGNVATVTHEDGSYWAYTYDGRDRLTLAVRYDAAAVEEYREAYTYDGGDNLLTKTVTEAGQSAVTTTYSVNNANELTAQSDGVTNVTYTYDEAGRQASKTDGTYTTLNSWRYADLLYKVESDDPNVPDVTYNYGGDGMRRERTTSTGDYTWYNYAGFSLQSEEDALGALERTYIAGLAELMGPEPSNALARYFTIDILGSTRGVWDGSKALLGVWEPTPYGSPFSDSLPSDVVLRFTGHVVDPITEEYYTVFRFYAPSLARWLSMDPLGMVDGTNILQYVGSNPVTLADPLGLADSSLNAAIRTNPQRALELYRQLGGAPSAADKARLVKQLEKSLRTRSKTVVEHLEKLRKAKQNNDKRFANDMEKQLKKMFEEMKKYNHMLDEARNLPIAPPCP